MTNVSHALLIEKCVRTCAVVGATASLTQGPSSALLPHEALLRVPGGVGRGSWSYGPLCTAGMDAVWVGSRQAAAPRENRSVPTGAQGVAMAAPRALCSRTTGRTQLPGTLQSPPTDSQVRHSLPHEDTRARGAQSPAEGSSRMCRAGVGRRGAGRWRGP